MRKELIPLAIIFFIFLTSFGWNELKPKLFTYIFIIIVAFIYGIIIEINSSRIFGKKKQMSSDNFQIIKILEEQCKLNFEEIIQSRLQNKEFTIQIQDMEFYFPKAYEENKSEFLKIYYLTLESFKIFKYEISKEKELSKIFVEVHLSFFDYYNSLTTVPDDKIWKLEHWVFEKDQEKKWILVNYSFDNSIKYIFKNIMDKFARIA